MVFISFIFLSAFLPGRVAWATALRGLGIPHGQQLFQIILLAKHQDGTKQGHRCSHSTLKKNFQLFTKIEDIHSYYTRQRSSIEYAIPRTRLKIAQKSCTYTGIGIWSSLDPTIRLIPNYHLFVTKLKHKLQEEQ